MLNKAKEPFRFFSRLSLPMLTGMAARNLAELLAGIQSSPETVIYYHTHKFLQEHQSLVPEPPNDFAYWVHNVLQNETLGERLMALDTMRFTSLSEYRDTLVEILKEGGQDNVSAPDGKEFHFMSAIRFSIPTGHVAWDLSEFAAQLKQVTISSVYLHVFEAKLRPPLGVNDFSHWFEHELGETTLARKMEELDPYMQTLEGLRAKIISVVEEKVKEAAHA